MNKFKKKLIFVLIGVGIGFTCFVIGWWTKNVQCNNHMLYYSEEIDSLTWAEVLREDEQLPYFCMNKRDVLAELPLPNSHGEGTLFDDGTMAEWHWIYNPYKKRLSGTRDTIIIDTHYWKIPYHDRPNLYIVFEKKDTSWIATHCVQWDSKRVSID